jgi:phosphinothricin acetyltransferase
MAPEASGKGLGRALLAELLTSFVRAGVRRVMAVIGDSANAGSVGVHRALGFEQVGVVPSCGWIFGRWLDIVLMQRSLGAGDSTPPESSEGMA